MLWFVTKQTGTCRRPLSRAISLSRRSAVFTEFFVRQRNSKSSASTSTSRRSYAKSQSKSKQTNKRLRSIQKRVLRTAGAAIDLRFVFDDYFVRLFARRCVFHLPRNERHGVTRGARFLGREQGEVEKV